MRAKMYQTALKTPVGTLQLFADDDVLYRIVFPACGDKLPVADPAPQGHPLLSFVSLQLNEYFTGHRQNFDLPLSPQGTPFQLAVWELMQQIPYGETKAYGELAARLGNPNKARAVGGAANTNPLPLVIPCHRVRGANGKLTGFAGGVEIKQFLLNLEKKRAQASVATDT
jgi:methylated-DNA-[protein]-cysteine S-methyltransferase